MPLQRRDAAPLEFDHALGHPRPLAPGGRDLMPRDAPRQHCTPEDLGVRACGQAA